MAEVEFKGTQRFELRRRLGEGGMGVVYEAFDRDRNAYVALKTLRNLDPSSLYRFKNEFRALADLRHSNLVELGALVHENGQWFFTMELVQGESFRRYVRPGDPETGDHDTEISPHADTMTLTPPAAGVTAAGSTRPVGYDEGRLRDALRQLCEGVAALHAARKVHRDLKPSNVLVTLEGRVVLVDFGLVADLVTGAQSTDKALVGTAAYMAPEQASSKPVGPAADWYSVGVMLYEALTGELPFCGSPLEVMMSKVRFEPLPPRSTVPEVPADLDALCVELLRADPARRPGEAEILDRVRAGRRPTVPSVAPPAGALSPFVGRAPEQAALLEAYRAVTPGHPVTVFLQGESGVGKSALARRFVESVSAPPRPATVLAGRCYEREHVPFKAFDGVVDALSRVLMRLDQVDAALLLPRDTPVLTRVFPVLLRAPAVARVPATRTEITNPQELRARAFAALRDLLGRLGERGPLIVLIDDLQWADADSLALLREVMHPPGAPGLMLLCTVRTVAETAMGLPRSVQAISAVLGYVRYLKLEALPPDEATTLAEELWAGAGGVAGADLDSLADEAGGHPLFIDVLVRHLVEVGAPAGASVRLDEALWARISRLDESVRRLLELIAVAGAPVAQDVAAEAAGLDAANLESAVSLLRASNLVRTRGVRGTDEIEPYHDRVREAVLARLDPAVLREHHARLAGALDQTGAARNDPQALVRHLETAGETERAAELAERAAAQAGEALAFDRAAALLETALRLGRHGDDKQRQLRFRYAEALHNSGQGACAAEVFLAAAAGAPAAVRLDCHRRAAECWLINGHVDRGLETITSVLAEVGGRLPATSRRALVSLLWNRAKLRVRGISFHLRDATEIPVRDLMRFDAYKAVALGLAMVDPVRGNDFHVRGLLLALRLGEPQRVGQALGVEAMFLGTQGLAVHGRARRLAAETERLARATSDPYLEAMTTSCDGFLDYMSGRFRSAVEKLRRAETMFRERTAGSMWELSQTRIFQLLALRYAGDGAELSRRFHEYSRDAVRRGDLYSATTLSRAFNLVWLLRDDPEEATRELGERGWAPPERGYHLQHWYELRSQVELALYRRERPLLDAAVAGFVPLERSLLQRVITVRTEGAWLRGRLALARAAAGCADVPQALKEAARAARRLEAEGATFADTWARLLRAGIAVREGRRDDAMALLGHVADHVGAHEMALIAAAARRRRGELEGGAAGDAAIADADHAMLAEGVNDPDRLAEIFAPGTRS